MSEAKRILILGGTEEAAELARLLAGRDGISVITSLSGDTANPAELPGEVVTGGFGGSDGLAKYLRAAGIDAVIDATHPFALQISQSAAGACSATGTPRLMLVRPEWQKQDGDWWHMAENMDEAARFSEKAGNRALLTVGKKRLKAFEGVIGTHFLVRLMEFPEADLPIYDYEAFIQRPPFTVEDEMKIMRDHEIDLLVAKNSGGKATYAKIEAAREMKIPVIMIKRPRLPEGERVETAAEAAEWAEKTLLAA
ncbi:MAG: cobalt-precorrin-6A reductase [Rhodospirillales bacterium]|nr:cobalt-precorrin-6A reductase [Rhodospirillales bacterium]MCW8952466.1 cobalt-precorrin-6A reductase [Rhodospirillales bacterium]MCW9002195.1 cobalt-precorrin-6A reductase [Rhodospirillales bacterium]MCW9040839.1 cobalt-precorrin-6A reductase [Rhodospirillales bacterium]